jgi:hypothetical protein
VVDQLGAALEDAREPQRRLDRQPEVPHPVGAALVWAVESHGAELRAARALQQRGGRKVLGVVEVAGHDHGLLAPVPAEQAGHQRAGGGRLGGAPAERVAREPGSSVLVGGGEAASGEGQQLGLNWQDTSDTGGPPSGVTVAESIGRLNCFVLLPSSSTWTGASPGMFSVVCSTAVSASREMNPAWITTRPGARRAR